MKKLSVTALALVAALSFAAAPRAHAQQQVSSDPATVQAGTYKVDGNHTQVAFSVLHLGFTYYTGLFSGVTGTLQIDPKDVATSKLDISIPIQSVMTTSPKLTDELKSADWLDAAKFPTATFVSTKTTKKDATTASIEGNLTLHGVTKPVTLDARFIGTGPNPLNKATNIGFEATGVVKRSEFGVTKYVPLIGDDVHLRIAGAFELQK